MNSLTNNKNTLTKFVASIRKNTPSQSTKTVLRFMTSIGVERSGHVVDGVKIYEYKIDGVPNYSCHTQREKVLVFLNAIKSLDVVNHRYILKHKSLVEQLERHVDSDEILSGLTPDSGVSVLRVEFRRLLRKYKCSRAVKKLLCGVQYEIHAYYVLHDLYKYLCRLVNSETNKVLKTKHVDRMSINPNPVIAKAISVLEGACSNPLELATALLIVTGRRASEICKTASFEYVTDNCVLFKGQLKTRTRDTDIHTVGYEIPVLCDANLVVSRLVDLRASWDKITLTYPDAVGEIVTHTLGDPKLFSCGEHTRAVSRKFPNLITHNLRSWFSSDKISCKTFRGLYSEITYLRLADKTVSKSAYTVGILGHGETEFGSALHYEQVAIDETIDLIDGGGSCEVKAAVNVTSGLLDIFKNKTVKIRGDKRSPSLHRMHDEICLRVERGEITTLEMITPSYLRKIVLNGKTLNANTAKKYVNMISTD